ncbi:MAG: amidase, partial [Candidatus Rokubacteria bacterium]|nr:amidase [Candidatus Rokubacteria bacterium]
MNTALDELRFLDATALVALIRRKEISAPELLEATVARIERLNPQLNAVVTPMYDVARRTAARGPAGPFGGVPFLLKDLNALYGGVPLRAGSAFLAGFTPGYDSELVMRLKRAGLVIVGKTNLSEFGILPTTESTAEGPTRNPWDLTRTPGGSSGGSAAAVAAGLVPFAHGNDGGGSIRIPASCCGLFGLKPTRARNPLGPDQGDVMSGLVVEHAITRSVRDSAALLDVTSGPDVGDPYWAPPAARAFAREVTTSPGRLRIAFTTATANGLAVHPDCVAAVHDAARLAEDLGHDVVEAAPKIEGEVSSQAFLTLWAAGCAWTIDGLAELTGRRPTLESLEPFTWALYRMGAETSASAYLRALQA